MKLYDIKDSYWMGSVIELEDGALFDSPWTPCGIEPPEVPTGSFARWIGGEWEITEEPPPQDVWLEQVKTEECARISAFKEIVKCSDFRYDFGSGVVAKLDNGQTVQAGVRYLQMNQVNRLDWQGQQARALAAKVLNQTSAVIVCRTLDNANVMCSPDQWLACFEAGAKRDQDFMIYAAQRKAVVKACSSIEQVEATKAATDQGWASI